MDPLKYLLFCFNCLFQGILPFSSYPCIFLYVGLPSEVVLDVILDSKSGILLSADGTYPLSRLFIRLNGDAGDVLFVGNLIEHGDIESGYT